MNIINLSIHTHAIIYMHIYIYMCYIYVHKGTCSLFHEIGPSATETKKEKTLFRLIIFGKMLL